MQVYDPQLKELNCYNKTINQIHCGLKAKRKCFNQLLNHRNIKGALVRTTDQLLQASDDL